MMTMMMNSTQVSYFILSAYFDTGTLKYLYFTIVLFLYMLIISANLLLIVVICVNRSLHEPMYLLLCSLFVSELYGSTGLFPFLLLQILSDVHTVSAPLCFLQMSYIYSYGSVEFLNLTVMSYDRYLSICYPLQYNTRMTNNRVSVLIAVIWLFSILVNFSALSFIVPLKLCGNIINKVYCDFQPLVKLSCSDVTTLSIYALILSAFSIFGHFILILYTYMRILKVCFSGSEQTRQKAISTCTPHLASFINFTCGAFFEIVQSRFDMNSLPNMLRIFFSLFFLTCPPLFNPVMYGLKLSKIHVMCKDLILNAAH